MSRIGRYATLTALGAAGLAASTVASRQRQQWRRSLWESVTAEDGLRLMHLRAAGHLTRSEVAQIIVWIPAYEPGVVVDALSRALLTDRPAAERENMKRRLLAAISAEIGPHVPRSPRPALLIEV